MSVASKEAPNARQEAKDRAKKVIDIREKRRLARERIGEDPERLAERIGIVDRDKYDVSDFTDKEINMALQVGS